MAVAEEGLNPYADPPPGAPAAGAEPAAPPADPSTAPFNGMAIASLVLAIAGLTCAGLVAAVPAVILGHLSWSQVTRGGQRGSALVVVGLVVGYFAIGVWLVAITVITAIVLVVAPGLH